MVPIKAKAQPHHQPEALEKNYDIQTPPSKRKPERIAHDILKQMASTLKIKTNLRALKFDKVKQSVLGQHVLFQQELKHIPISDAWIRVDIDKSGSVYNIMNDLVPEQILKKAEKLELKKVASQNAGRTSPQLTQEEAAKIAIKAAGSGVSLCKDSAPEIVYYCYHKIPTLAWKLIVIAEHPAAEWKIYIDAITGLIIKRVDLLRYMDGIGLVFDPNPVAALNSNIVAPFDSTTSISQDAYKQVVLRDLDESGMLDGPFVSTRITTNRITKTDFQFLFNKKDRAFREVMAYYHIDTFHRYIVELGFDDLLNKQIEIQIDGITGDQSRYSVRKKNIMLGAGGIDDAEDAEIIIHEYGHAIQDDKIPGFGEGSEALAIGEGFSDYLAASFFCDKKAVLYQPTIGSWGNKSNVEREPQSLRRLDSSKKYPHDITEKEHENAEIWSACLWQIRQALGSRMADKLIIAKYQFLTRKATFKDAANALLRADKILNDGENERTIKEVFIERGILTS